MEALSILVSILTISHLAFAKVPAWVKDGTNLRGYLYTVSCSATAPSIHQARLQAIINCKSSAVDQLNTRMEFKSVVIETEKDTAVHVESSSDTIAKHLVCEPQREEIEELSDSFKIWILCRFDFRRTATESVDDSTTKSSTIELAERVQSRNVAVQPSVDAEAESKSVTISTIPSCDSILIRGRVARIVRCDRNPIAILVNKSDKELIVRKSNYKAKSVSVSEIFQKDEEALNVFLDQ